MIKKLTLSLLAAILLVLPSCSDNDVDIVTFDTSLIPGEWCSLSASGDAMVLNMAYNHSYKGSTYTFTDGVVYEDNVTGIWMYYTATSSIVMTVLNSQNQTTTTPYALKELSTNKMVLQNKDLGSTETFYPMISDEKITIGSNFESGYGDVSFISNESVLKKEDSSTQVTAVGSGTSFVQLEKNGNIYIQKIVVDYLIDGFINNIYGTIEDMLETYGTPDVTGSVGYVEAVLYKSNIPEGLKAVQFNYDESTSEITKVVLQFSSDEVFESQLQYIASTHYYYESINVYHDMPDAFSSNYVIGFVINDDGSLYITIINEPYLTEHGYS